MIRKCLRAGLFLAISSATAWAQGPPPPTVTGDPVARPTEAGFRFTPGLARMMARQYTSHLTARFDLDKTKADEATEKVARRLMQMFHQLDGPGQELLERFMEEQLSANADGERAFVPRKFTKEFADRVLPMMPAIRDLARGTVQDVRPMLPLKQQLKLAGEMMAFNTGIDAFEAQMQEWSAGKAANNADPFSRADREVTLDELGQSQALKRARERAQSAATRAFADEWQQYVKDAKSFYGFDESQSATADSILRECLDRAEQIQGQEPWRSRYYRNRIWSTMIFQIPAGWNNPLRPLLDEEQDELTAGLKALGNDLKTRIDRIPTTAQRRSADQKIESLLAEKGLEMPSTRSPAQTQPAGGAQ